MNTLSKTTIILLEAALTTKFTIEDGFLPETSALPYLQAYSINSGYRHIYRQIRTTADFRCWCAAIHGVPLGTRVVWLAGHGEFDQGQGKTVEIEMPDDLKAGNRLTPRVIKRGLARCGKLNGIIVDSCGFGINPPRSWLPSNVQWALTFDRDVAMLNSIFLGFKTLDWLLDDDKGPPASGQVAMKRFLSGIKTDRTNEDRVDFAKMAQGMGTYFHWRDRDGWKTWKAV